MSKGGQKLQSGRLTHLVDQQICWYGWCWLAVPFVVSVPFDDKICWYGQAFRINILCNRPILLMEQICATVVVQFLQCSLHCAMWPVYICKGLLGQYYCIVCLFVCCVSYVYCLSLEQLLCPWDELNDVLWYYLLIKLYICNMHITRSLGRIRGPTSSLLAWWIGKGE